MTYNDEEKLIEKQNGFTAFMLRYASLIIKLVLVAVLAAFLVVVYRMNNAKDVEASVIQTALTEQTDIAEVMAECDEHDLMQFLSLDADDYEYFIYYKGTEALSAAEVLVIKADSDEVIDAAEEAVNARISAQLTAFDGYGTEQVKQLNNAIVTTRGTYLFYCTAGDPDEYEEVFKDVI